jgi:hypothetical protein
MKVKCLGNSSRHPSTRREKKRYDDAIYSDAFSIFYRMVGVYVPFGRGYCLDAYLQCLHQRSTNRKPPGSISASGVSKISKLLECLLAALNVECIDQGVTKERSVPAMATRYFYVS